MLSFQLSAFLFGLSRCIPNSALNTVLLVVLEHPSTFLPVVAICTVSSSFTNFAFRSHTSPAYSSYCTVIFIGIHILILVSRCKSGRIVSIMSTCTFTLSYYVRYVCIPRSVL